MEEGPAADLTVSLEGPFVHRKGAAWSAVRPASHREDMTPAAGLILREDGRGLGPGNAMEADIIAKGGGRYAIWPDEVCFSATDGSNPNLNGRVYALTCRPKRSAPAPAPHALAPWRAPSHPIGCAVIGVGQRGADIAHRLAGMSGVDLRWLVDPAADRIEACRASLAPCDPRASADVDCVIADPGVRSVIIATPDHTHADLAIRCLEAGRHVFLEKPIAINLEDGWRIVRAWRDAGAVLRLGYVLRHTAFFATVRETLFLERLGPVRTITLSERLGVEHGASFMRRWHRRSAASGGLMVHKGCHDLDLICWLVDRAPAKVASFGGVGAFSRPAPASHCSVCPERTFCPYEDRGAYEERSPAERADPARFGLDVCVFGADKDIVDNQVVAFELIGGIRGVYSLSMQNPGGSQRTLTIHGDDGRLEGDFEAGAFTIWTNDGAPPVTWSPPSSPTGGHGGGDEATLTAFLDASLGRSSAPEDTPADALRGLAFALAAERSRRLGAVVNVREDLSGFD